MKLTDLDDVAEDQLRTLDARFVAAAAPRVARLRDRFVRTVEGVRGVDLRDLQGLDERYASRGPLALFREVPQLLAVLAGVVFMVGTLDVAHHKEPVQVSGDQTVQQPGSAAADTGSVLSLGPAIGKPATTYLRAAAESLTAAATGSPDSTRLAMVSLTSYARPEQLASILSGYDVKRAWVRTPTAGKLAPPMLLEVDGDVVAAVKAFQQQQGSVQKVAASKYQMLADTAVGDPASAKFYRQLADLARDQSKAFLADCACAYAFVVQATPSQLQSLRSRPEIRSIEVAGTRAKLGDLDITTLLPEVTGVVPNPAENDPPPS